MPPVQDEWEVQTTLKHGPAMNDRGDRLFMTNLRGYTVGAVLDHLEDFAEKKDRFDKAFASILASDAIVSQFPQSERVREQSAPASGGGGAFKDRDGEICEPHKLPMKWKQIKSKKDGKWYELLECTAPKGQQCDTIWDN